MNFKIEFTVHSSGDFDLSFDEPSLWQAMLSDYEALVTNNTSHWQNLDLDKRLYFFYYLSEYLKSLSNVSARVQNAFVDFYNSTLVTMSINGVSKSFFL